jgi:alginate O-acetyltransferase complex protein AlgI
VLFTEPTFLFLFLPILLGLYFAPWSKGRALYRNVLLLVASVVFYADGGGSFTGLMLASITFNYVMAILVARAADPLTSRRVVGFAVAVNLTVLGVFKYAGFATQNLNTVLAAFGTRGIAPVHVLLPIGISFYTFHAISYVVDVYRRDATAQKSPVHAGLYMLLFPQLIAGPIVRYRDLAGQLAERRVTLDDFAAGVRRFVIGLAKKLLIANIVAGTADRVFEIPPARCDAAHAWLGIACYALQIYFDFSGYSDMAIGLARMFGFRFPENFRYPYIADTIQEFWRRWHISLSSWFRDYLYIPLGGNRVPRWRQYVNLGIVFFLCGLWHGAQWTFVVWGLFHGLFLILERLGLAALVRRLWAPLRHAYALLVVAVGWVFFRATTLPQAFDFLRSMAGLTRTEPVAFTVFYDLTPDLCLALIAGTIGATPVLATMARWREALPRTLDACGDVVVVVLMALAILRIAAGTYNPFIYFRF